MVPRGEEKHKLLAVLLFDEFRYSQTAIANLMKVSQSTISSWIKYGRLLLQNKELQQEVNILREELKRIECISIQDLKEDIIDIIG